MIRGFKFNYKLPQIAWQQCPRFDRLMLLIILGAMVLLGILFWQTKPAPIRVSHFSWDGKIIGDQDRFFSLTFEQPVDRDLVEKGLTIDPPLPGKVSWNTRQLFYTLTELPVYGQTYDIKLKTPNHASTSATSGTEAKTSVIASFVSRIRTRDRAFAYIGIKGPEKGKLILFNINQQSKTVLTPADLVVTQFAIYPQGDRILLSAFSTRRQDQGLAAQQLYTVTTGLNFASPQLAKPSGQIALVLDSKTYQNQKFALAMDGSAIVVQRENRTNPVDRGLWVLSNDEPPRPLGITSSDFVVAPDGASVAVTNPDGIVLLPLTSFAQPAQLLPGYDRLLGYSHDGRKLLVTKFNPEDESRSLVLLTEAASAQEILRSPLPILSCTLEPRQEQRIYCLKTETISEAQQYRLEPYLATIDLTSKQEVALLNLPNYRDVQISMSPDGLFLLFDQVVSINNFPNPETAEQTGQAISAARLWLLPLPNLKAGESPTPTLPEALFEGFNPHWLP